MSTIPSLALIPSGYKGGSPKGTLYSVLPTDGVGDFDFTRSGNATRVNSEGLIETVGSNVPRLDYPLIDGVVSGCPSLLLEPSRTNYVTYSENFSNASWVKSAGTTLTSNYGIAPNGLNQSTLIQWSATQQFIYTIISSQGQETSSIYIKGISGQEIKFGRTDSVAIGNLFTFDGTWQRLEISTDNAGTVFFLSTFNDGNATDFEIWGAQLEAGSYATSIIPTQGAISTRVAESCSNAGNSQIFNDSEGTVFINFAADFNIFNSGLPDRGISINNGSNTNSARIFQATSLNNRMAYDLDTSSGTNQVFNTSTTFADITDFNKVAFTYKQNEFKIFLNGVQQGSTDTNGSVFSNGTLSGLSFDYGEAGNNPFFGRVKEVKYFNTALSDAELAALTKI